MNPSSPTAAAGPLGRAVARFNRVLDDFNLILFVLLLVVATLQVLMRYVIRMPLPWTEELARFLLIWVTFLGAASVTRRKLHIKVEFLSQRYPPRTAAALNALIYLVMALFMGVIGWGSIVLFDSSWPVHAGTMPALRMSWVYLGAILGVVMMVVICLNHCLREVRFLAGRAAAGPGE